MRISKLEEERAQERVYRIAADPDWRLELRGGPDAAPLSQVWAAPILSASRDAPPESRCDWRLTSAGVQFDERELIKPPPRKEGEGLIYAFGRLDAQLCAWLESACAVSCGDYPLAQVNLRYRVGTDGPRSEWVKPESQGGRP